MNELAKLFETNRFILYSAYGQVFFVLGLAVLLQTRRHSRLALARGLWLLGAFGILHGVSEWAYVFVPIQAEYLPRNIVRLLWLAHTVIEVLSFAFLFEFGISLLWPKADGGRRGRLLKSPLIATWIGLSFFVVIYFSQFGGPGGRSLLAAGDALGRYLLALPGATFASLGLLREAHKVQAMALPGIPRYLRLAAASFLVYAFAAGLLVPAASFFPANVLNNDLLQTTIGIPAPVFRSACGLAIAYFVLRAMRVFHLEMDREIEEMERDRTIAVERERFGRELHDGTIQSLYAAGLALEDVTLTLDREPQLARQKVREIMAALNGTVGDIREYILDLHSIDDLHIEKQLRMIAHQFADRLGLTTDVKVIGTPGHRLSPDIAAELLQVAREAFANVAKHAAAKNVAVVLTCSSDAITLEVADDGRGFDLARALDASSRRNGNGLHNMTCRMETLGGSVHIESSPRKGTRLRATVAMGGPSR